ncbi:MAG: amidophosphoribosyltransferase [Mycoplasmoidaceae bacterium]|nr:amidophosphoribosyltransferase [Mycoplasmoidaceae bacterium]
MQLFETTLDFNEDKFKDECGVFGVYSNNTQNNVALLTYYGLFALQHRGQESAGIAISTGKRILCKKDLGYVGDIFNKKMLEKLSASNPKISIGHVRYSTAGKKTVANAQPFVVKTKIGKIAVAHNGNLINVESLRNKYRHLGVKFVSTVDSELFANMIAYNLKCGDTIENAIINTTKAVKGAYSLVVLTKDKLLGLRDPHGIRPLCLGQLQDGSYILSSESCAFSSTGAKFVRDIKNGELVAIYQNKINSMIYANASKRSCIFEYVYFARPDSTIDGINCYLSRIEQGKTLYKEHPLKADMVIASPESGNYAAMGYSQASKIPFGIGLIKNRYIARTFIKPSQELRERDVYIKLNPLEVNVKGKDLILIDDSIVRGTSSLHFVKALKKAGAKKIYMLSASPMVKFPCYLGIDTPNKEDLIAANNTIEQMREKIGCDYLGFLSLEGLYKTCGNTKTFCDGCFSGKYPVTKK